MKTYNFLLVIWFNASLLLAQPSAEELSLLSKEVLPSAISSFREFLSIPNNGLVNSHIEANMRWCEDAFQQRGFETQRLETQGPPLLLATMIRDIKLPTVLIYLQIDGQPVDSSKWQQSSPYTPVVKKREADQWTIIDWPDFETTYDPEWRIFARSASDAKGPVMMFLAAMDVMNNTQQVPDYNLKIIMDFEEELGSPHLPNAVIRYKEQLAADMLLILDGPRHPNNQPTLTFGARGISTITLTVFGPKTPQHSGHYGNYIPNPAFRLSRLLSSMKDDEGRVTIPGFYDGVEISDEVRRILKRVPDDEEKIRHQLGIAKADSVAETLQEAIQYPSLNIRGLSSGWVGDDVRTIIPAEAIAEIDIRLVKESDGHRLVNLVQDYIKNQGYYVIDREPTGSERSRYSKIAAFTYQHSYAAFRTDFESSIGVFLERALQRAFTVDPIRIRTSGGSIPISPFVSTLAIPAVTVPTVNRDNNQHSPNENIRVGNFLDGIKTCLAILTQPIPQ